MVTVNPRVFLLAKFHHLAKEISMEKKIKKKKNCARNLPIFELM
jgi:hypothetical protein